jgi:hypothetical protein
VHAEDGALRRIDDRRGQQRAEGAAIGDAEGAAREFLERDRAAASPRCKFAMLLLDAGEA